MWSEYTGYDFSGEQGGYGGSSTGYYPAEQYLHPGNSMINYDPQYYNGGQYLNQQFAYDGVIDYPPHLDASGQIGNHEHLMHHPAPPGSIVNLTVEGSSDADESVLLRQALSSRDDSGTGSNNNLNKDGGGGRPTAVPKLSGSDNSTTASASSGGGGGREVNPSLQGSLLSVNSHGGVGRPPSTISKTRNITQV